MPRWVVWCAYRNATAVTGPKATIQTANPTTYTIGRSIAAVATPSLAKSLGATTSESTKDVAVTAADRRPSVTVSSADLDDGNASAIARKNGEVTENMRTENR